MQFVKAVESTQSDYFILDFTDSLLFVNDFKSSQKIFLKKFFHIDNSLDKKILFEGKWFKNFQDFFSCLELH